MSQPQQKKSQNASLKKGLVLRCSRNSYTVKTSDGAALECHLKGKQLKNISGFYNPLAPGDIVTVEEDSKHRGKGRIVSPEKRRNYFSRFNAKGQAPQLLAANVDLVLCLTTPESPPFRPRFLDRVLLQCDAAGIEALVVCNKIDLGFKAPDVMERLDDFSRIGYRVLKVSAQSNKGLNELKPLMDGKTVVLIGQSGVGKSSLINAMYPGIDMKTGAMNEKYDRGNHTTVMPVMLELPLANSAIGTDSASAELTRIIDTPGIRLFLPHGIDADDLVVLLREFAPFAGKCAYGLSCSHREEQGCKILQAVESGAIHADRYNSYLRIYDEMRGLTDRNYGD